MKYSTSLILLLLSLVVNTISAQKPTMSTVGGTYTLVTSLDEIDDDGIYLIACNRTSATTHTLYVMATKYEVGETGFSYVQYTYSYAGTESVPKEIAYATVNEGTVASGASSIPYEYRLLKYNDGYIIQDINGLSVSNDLSSTITNLHLNSSTTTEDNKWIISPNGNYARFDIYYSISTSKYRIGITTGSGNKFNCSSASRLSPNIYKKTSATLPLTIGATGYATLYYGKYDVLLPEGLMAYTYGATETSDGKVSLVKSNIFNGGDRIPAGTAVILRGKENTNYSLSLLTPDESLEKVAGNLLHGTDVATTTVAPDSRDYLFYKLSKSSSTADVSTLGFYWGAIDGGAFSIGAHKAYLALPTSQAAKLHSAVIYCNYEDELVAGIKHISHTEKTNNIITDLSGRRLTNKPSKGLYIQNGKKFIVK